MSGEIQVNAIELDAATTLTIATGAVTITGSVHIIAAESGTADLLDTITLGTNFDSAKHQLIFLIADTGDTITVKHNTDNIVLNGAADFSLTDVKMLALLRDPVSGDWHDLGA
jgi:hypothetical protein